MDVVQDEGSDASKISAKGTLRTSLTVKVSFCICNTTGPDALYENSLLLFTCNELCSNIGDSHGP